MFRQTNTLNNRLPFNGPLMETNRWTLREKTTTQLLLVFGDTKHTHAHPFNGPFSGTTRVSQYQKGKTNLDFTEAGDSEWQWHHLGHMQVCTSIQTDNYASTAPLSFLQAGCPSCHPTNSIKALKAILNNIYKYNILSPFAVVHSTLLGKDNKWQTTLWQQHIKWPKEGWGLINIS